MVLHPGGWGRVSYRRHLNKQKLHTITTRQDTLVLTGLFGIPICFMTIARMRNRPGFRTGLRALSGRKRYSNEMDRGSSYRFGDFHSRPRNYVPGRCGWIKATTLQGPLAEFFHEDSVVN